MDDRFAIINILSFNPHTMSNLTKKKSFIYKGLILLIWKKLFCKSLKGKKKEKYLDPFKERALKINWFHKDGEKPHNENHLATE